MDKKEFEIIPIDKKHKTAARKLLENEWSSTKVVTKGVLYDCMSLPGYIAVKGGKLAGMITYNISGKQCEIITLNSLAEGEGIAEKLIEKVKETAKEEGCLSVRLITTNDNTKAIRYYQKRGFSLIGVHINAINKSRELKPEIPLTGSGGIPILHEFEFEIII